MDRTAPTSSWQPGQALGEECHRRKARYTCTNQDMISLSVSVYYGSAAPRALGSLGRHWERSATDAGHGIPARVNVNWIYVSARGIERADVNVQERNAIGAQRNSHKEVADAHLAAREHVQGSVLDLLQREVTLSPVGASDGL